MISKVLNIIYMQFPTDVSDDLAPPEDQECEKRLVQHFDKVKSLPTL